MAKQREATDLVTVYPSVHGLFFDGIPAVVQQVDEKTAEAWCLHGTFTRELPAGYRVTEGGTLAGDAPADAPPA